MQIQELHKQLNSLSGMLSSLTPEDYRRSSSMLGNSSIGQHTRHIIELAQALVKGYGAGKINYDQRERNGLIETEIAIAINNINEIIDDVVRPDSAIVVETIVDEDYYHIHSSYFREVHYNTEHAIHHMALIKVALREFNLEITDPTFGYAPSTIAYQKSISAS